MEMPATPVDFERENSVTTIGSHLTSRGNELPANTPSADELASMIATRTSTMVTEERSGSPNLVRGITTAAELEAAAEYQLQKQSESEPMAEQADQKETSDQGSAESDGKGGSDGAVVVPPVTPTLGLKPGTCLVLYVE